MHRDLADTEIDDLLQTQLYGHLGCTLPDGRVYVVPITFVYRDGIIYSFSSGGQKIDALRAHPSACLQVEQYLHEGSWRSAIAWGTYEELSDGPRLTAARLLFERLDMEEGMAMSPLYNPPPRAAFLEASRALTEKESIFYCIRVERKTGKQVQYD